MALFHTYNQRVEISNNKKAATDIKELVKNIPLPPFFPLFYSVNINSTLAGFFSQTVSTLFLFSPTPISSNLPLICMIKKLVANRMVKSWENISSGRDQI